MPPGLVETGNGAIIAPWARVAYAQGWAVSGGPMTERVKAGCIAAVQVAIEHADDPDVLEVTLQLGALEGTWAAVYDRRDKLHRRNEDDILAAWRQLDLAALAADVVTAVRQHAGLTERAGSGFLDWITGLIRRLFADRINVGTWHRLSEAVRTALTRAKAEGRAAALALAANRQGIVGLSFDLAFDDAYRALQHAADLSGAAEVDAWLTRLLGDAASEVGDRLAVLARDEASYEEMVDAVDGILGGADGQAVRTAIDVLTSRALSQGALDLYRSEGVTRVDFLTAGDGRVCARCSALEERNPYQVGDAPLSGQHPWCRCAVAARDDLPATLLARYFDPTVTSAT